LTSAAYDAHVLLRVLSRSSVSVTAIVWDHRPQIVFQIL
jgi:hypothetical protein